MAVCPAAFALTILALLASAAATSPAPAPGVMVGGVCKCKKKPASPSRARLPPPKRHVFRFRVVYVRRRPCDLLCRAALGCRYCRRFRVARPYRARLCTRRFWSRPPACSFVKRRRYVVRHAACFSPRTSIFIDARLRQVRRFRFVARKRAFWLSRPSAY